MDEGQRVLRQVAAVADRLGLIGPEGPEPQLAYLQNTLDTLGARAELASLVAHATGLLGKFDVLIVLDRSIAAVKR